MFKNLHQEEFERVRPDRQQFISIIESNLPSEVALNIKQRFAQETRCDSASFVKEFRRNQRERSANRSSIGSAGSTRSGSGNSATSSGGEMRKQLQRKDRIKVLLQI